VSVVASVSRASGSVDPGVLIVSGKGRTPAAALTVKYTPGGNA